MYTSSPCNIRCLQLRARNSRTGECARRTCTAAGFRRWRGLVILRRVAGLQALDRNLIHRSCSVRAGPSHLRATRFNRGGCVRQHPGEEGQASSRRQRCMAYPPLGARARSPAAAAGAHEQGSRSGWSLLPTPALRRRAVNGLRRSGCWHAGPLEHPRARRPRLERRVEVRRQGGYRPGRRRRREPCHGRGLRGPARQGRNRRHCRCGWRQAALSAGGSRTLSASAPDTKRVGRRRARAPFTTGFRTLRWSEIEGPARTESRRAGRGRG